MESAPSHKALKAAWSTERLAASSRRTVKQRSHYHR